MIWLRNIAVSTVLLALCSISGYIGFQSSKSGISPLVSEILDKSLKEEERIRLQGMPVFTDGMMANYKSDTIPIAIPTGILNFVKSGRFKSASAAEKDRLLSQSFFSLFLPLKFHVVDSLIQQNLQDKNINLDYALIHTKMDKTTEVIGDTFRFMFPNSREVFYPLGVDDQMNVRLLYSISFLEIINRMRISSPPVFFSLGSFIALCVFLGLIYMKSRTKKKVDQIVADKNRLMASLSKTEQQLMSLEAKSLQLQKQKEQMERRAADLTQLRSIEDEYQRNEAERVKLKKLYEQGLDSEDYIVLTFDAYYHKRSRQLFYKDSLLHLTPQSLRILEALLLTKDFRLPKEQLVKKVWNVYVTEGTIRQAILRLNKSLEKIPGAGLSSSSADEYFFYVEGDIRNKPEE